MPWEITAVYIVLAVTVALFVSDRLRPDIVGLLIMAVLGLLGILKPKELLAGFGNQALVTIAAMFVLSAALIRSGLVAALGGKLTELSRGSPLRFLVLALLSVCFMSAFINNTPVVVVFIPAVLTVCNRLGQSPSKFLMPISFASMLGGSCTLIGTSSNILVSALSAEAGFGEIGMFEFAAVGLMVVAVGLVYLVAFSARLLPNRTTIASTLSAEDVKEYITQVRIGPESHLIGCRLTDTPLAKAGVKVAELIRGDRIQRLQPDMRLEVDDILLLRGDLNKILELDREHEISIDPEMNGRQESVKRVEMTVFELMVAPESRLIGRTCRQIGLRQEFGVSVFALQRRGRHHQRNIADVDLRMGDILLVRGSMDALERLHLDRQGRWAARGRYRRRPGPGDRRRAEGERAHRGTLAHALGLERGRAGLLVNRPRQTVPPQSQRRLQAAARRPVARVRGLAAGRGHAAQRPHRSLDRPRPD